MSDATNTNTSTDDNCFKFEDIPTPEVDMKYQFVSVPIIKYFTAMVRASFEYKSIIQHMKTFMDFNRCAYYEGYGLHNGFGVELHHSPFTLFDICQTVSNKHMALDGFVRTMDVCEEVALLHFQFKVGLVPLNPTAHKLFHSDSLEIHPKLVKGYWKDFYDEYNEYITEEMKIKYNRACEMEKQETVDSLPPILERKEFKIDVKNQIKLSDLNLTQLLIDSPTKRLEQIE